MNQREVIEYLGITVKDFQNLKKAKKIRMVLGMAGRRVYAGKDIEILKFNLKTGGIK